LLHLIDKEMNDKKEMILDVAEKLFAEHGYDGTSTRMLAKEAGINIAMLSYYFGSKDKLFGALVERRLGQTREKIQSMAVQVDDPWERLESVIDLYVEKMLSNHCFHKIIHREISLQQHGEMHQLITDSLLKNSQEVARIIHDGQEKKLFRQVDVEMTICTFFGTIRNLVNSSALAARLLNMENSAALLESPNIKSRLKTHLKDLMHAHLKLA
jgi:AcrR family transcriptional regulator